MPIDCWNFLNFLNNTGFLWWSWLFETIINLNVSGLHECYLGTQPLVKCICHFYLNRNKSWYLSIMFVKERRCLGLGLLHVFAEHFVVAYVVNFYSWHFLLLVDVSWKVQQNSLHIVICEEILFWPFLSHLSCFTSFPTYVELFHLLVSYSYCAHLSIMSVLHFFFMSLQSSLPVLMLKNYCNWIWLLWTLLCLWSLLLNCVIFLPSHISYRK